MATIAVRETAPRWESAFGSLCRVFTTDVGGGVDGTWAGGGDDFKAVAIANAVHIEVPWYPRVFHVVAVAQFTPRCQRRPETFLLKERLPVAKSFHPCLRKQIDGVTKYFQPLTPFCSCVVRR